jgi:hypothetical protein
MAEQEPQNWDEATFIQVRQQVMERLQCSEEEATNRVRATIQALLDGTQIPPINPPANPPQNPPPDTAPDPPLIPPTTPTRNEEVQHSSRKKAVFIDFDLDTTIADRIPHTPSQFAVGRIQDMEYVELWYFTTEGCKEASKATPTTADNTYGILSTDSGLTLQSIKATKASRNAIADENLNWEQITTARHTLIATANRVGWPDKHTFALAGLYINLEALKAAGYNPRALILYHAVVRRQWHEAMKGRGTPFNLSIVNEKLFGKLENQIRDHDQEELYRKASKNLFR